MRGRGTQGAERGQAWREQRGAPVRAEYARKCRQAWARRRNIYFLNPSTKILSLPMATFKSSME